MLKYVCIGLPKTGTTSLTEAFNILGFKAHHGSPCGETGKFLSEHGMSILNQYDFVSDQPFIYRYKEMEQAFDGLRYIHTVRNIDRWLKSCEHHFSNYLESEHRQALFGTYTYDIHKFRKGFQKHRDRAVAFGYRLPKERFITMNICDGVDGWDTLCNFLNITQVPNVQFPIKNKRRLK